MTNPKNLPPQAYTRETLVEAFNWLQTQSADLRKQAQSPDDLVSLYMRAKRFGNDLEKEAPVSSRNFKSDLKNLARGLQNFDKGSFEEQSSTPVPNSHKPASPVPNDRAREVHRERGNEPMEEGKSEAQAGYNITNQLPPELLRKLEDIRSEVRAQQRPPAEPAPTFTPPPQTAPMQQGRKVEIDEKSWAAIVRLQNSMNLSSPEEALRVVLAAGCKKLGKFLEIGD